MRDAVTTQVQFTCLEGSRRQIPGRKFSARTPKGTQSSVKISSLEKEFVFPYDGTRKHSPAHRSLFYIGGQTSRLNLSSSLLPTVDDPRNFRTNFPLIFAFYQTRTRLSGSRRLEPQTRVNASLFWFVYTIPLWIPRLIVARYPLDDRKRGRFLCNNKHGVASFSGWSLLLHIVRRRNNHVERKNWWSVTLKNLEESLFRWAMRIRVWIAS